MFEQTVEFQFDAAHALRGYEGKCARLHGHGYRVQVAIRGRQLDEIGMLMDFRRLRASCKQILDQLDHRHLNELPPFDKINPTCENIAHYLFDRLSAVINDDHVAVGHVTVWETPTSAVTFRPEATS